VSPTRAVTNFCHALAHYLNDHITAQRIELVFLFAGALTLEAVLVLADVGGAHLGILLYTGVFARSQIVYKRFCPEGSPIPRRSIAAGSEADLERARLLHQYALHQCRPDADSSVTIAACLLLPSVGAVFAASPGTGGQPSQSCQVTTTTPGNAGVSTTPGSPFSATGHPAACMRAMGYIQRG